MTGSCRALAVAARVMLGTAVLAGAGCSAGGPVARSGGAAAPGVTSTSGAVTPADTPTPGGTAPVPASTTTTAVPRRPTAPTTSSSTKPAAGPAPAQAPSTTTSTEWQVPDENLEPTPDSDADPDPWVPPSTQPPPVHTTWTPAIGVEMTPPYEPPTVTAADYLGCTRRGGDNVFIVRARATLSGGRYWRFPGAANGTTGIFEKTYAGIVGRPVDPKGFDGSISYVTVETGDGTHKNVPVSPEIRFHCPAS
jgi:hypothetical protein